MSDPYRVIIWGPGAVGTQVMKLVHDRPELELVGVVCHSPSKDGLDAGEYIGGQASGVKLSADSEAVFALDADVVIIAAISPPELHASVLSLLESGKNVISSGMYFFPPYHGDAVAEQLSAAARKGGSTLHGTGELPGMFLDRIAATLTGLTMEVDHLKLEEYASFAHGNLEWDLFGIGKPVEEARPNAAIFEQMLKPGYAESLALVSTALFGAMPEVEMQTEFVPADHEIVHKKGTIRTGHVGQLRFTYTATVEGDVRITLVVNWVFEGDDRWVIEYDGAPVSMRAEFTPLSTPRSSVDYDTESSYPSYADAVASVLVQSVGLTCEAPPGILYPSVFASATPDLRRLSARTSIAG